MFQSFKKWVKNDDAQQRPAPPSGMQLMKGDLQRKFAKGVQYNMKIVIRGDRNTGKTSLWHRLRGNKFMEEYIPTAEIQVASIHWDYKATDDIVKVDVWDVVDQGKKKESKGLKISDEPTKEALEQQVLDATFLDVYKHAHAVILLFDITKKWTFKYIERELPNVPSHIPVLVLANFRDMGDHRVVTVDEVEALVESVDRKLNHYYPKIPDLISHMDRPPGSPSVMFFECSMKNSFGLKYVHKFFNMPFLLVQRESLLKQLETNHLDLESCVEELSTEEHGYDAFMQRMQDPRKRVPSQTQMVQKQTPEHAKTPTNERLSGHTSAANSTPVAETTSQVPKETKSPSVGNNAPSPGAKGGLFSSAQMETQTPTTPPAEPEKRGFMSRFFKRSSNDPMPVKEQVSEKIEVPVSKTGKKSVSNVDEFVPDDGSVDDFLNEIPDAKERQPTNDLDSSDEDEDAENPMVAGFQEDLDSDDDFAPSYKRTTYSSTDSEPEAAKPVTKPPQKVVFPNKPAERKSSPPHQPPSSLNIPKSAKPEIQESSESEDDIPRPEIIQDADLSSDENLYSQKTDFAVISNKSPVDKSPDIAPTLPSVTDVTIKSKKSTPQRKQQQIEDSNSEEDTKENVIVSNAYDDISSDDESTPPQPPVAIVTPLQAERSISFEEETDLKPKSEGLNLEFSATDLNFFEQTAKQPAVNDERRSSKEGRSHRSKKSSSRRSEEDGSSKKSHKKHKKHRTKDKDEQDNSKSEESRSHRTKEDRERKKKRKSKDSELSTKSESKVDNDLEAFLNGM